MSNHLWLDMLKSGSLQKKKKYSQTFIQMTTQILFSNSNESIASMVPFLYLYQTYCINKLRNFVFIFSILLLHSITNFKIKSTLKRLYFMHVLKSMLLFHMGQSVYWQIQADGLQETCNNPTDHKWNCTHTWWYLLILSLLKKLGTLSTYWEMKHLMIFCQLWITLTRIILVVDQPGVEDGLFHHIIHQNSRSSSWWKSSN